MRRGRDYTIFLEDIIESAELIKKYAKGYTKKRFSSDEKNKDAVIRRFEVIGEAVKHLPNSFRKKHKEVDWKKISGMRDVLIHEYFGVNIDKVWKTIKKDIPDLENKISKILAELKINKLI